MWLPWQALLSLIILALWLTFYAVTVTQYYRLRHHAFFACRMPAFAIVAATYGTATIGVILLQTIVNSTRQSQAGHWQINDGFPCLILLVANVSVYPLYTIPNTMRGCTTVVRYNMKYRQTKLVRVLQYHVRRNVLIGVTAAALVLGGILAGSLNRYRLNEQSESCYLMAEWYVYWPLTILIGGAFAKVNAEMKIMNDVYRLSDETNLALKAIAYFQLPYYIINVIFDALQWGNSGVIRAEIEYYGLPFEWLAMCYHMAYVTTIIYMPLRWLAQWRAENERESSSRKQSLRHKRNQSQTITSTNASAYRPSNLDSMNELSETHNNQWLSEMTLSDDDDSMTGLNVLDEAPKTLDDRQATRPSVLVDSAACGADTPLHPKHPDFTPPAGGDFVSFMASQWDEAFVTRSRPSSVVELAPPSNVITAVGLKQASVKHMRTSSVGMMPSAAWLNTPQQLPARRVSAPNAPDMSGSSTPSLQEPRLAVLSLVDRTRSQSPGLSSTSQLHRSSVISANSISPKVVTTARINGFLQNSAPIHSAQPYQQDLGSVKGKVSQLRQRSSSVSEDPQHRAAALSASKLAPTVPATPVRSKRPSRVSQLANSQRATTAQPSTAKKPIKWTCIRVLRDPTLFAAFEQHAQRTLNGENTEFWKECEEYRTLWYAHKEQKAEQRKRKQQHQPEQHVIDIPNPLNLPLHKSDFCIHIWNKYLKHNAPFELNISDTLRKQYKDAIEGKYDVSHNNGPRISIAVVGQHPAATVPAEAALPGALPDPMAVPTAAIKHIGQGPRPSIIAYNPALTTTATMTPERARAAVLFTLLSEVQKVIYRLMETNIYKSFKLTAQFKELTGHDDLEGGMELDKLNMAG